METEFLNRIISSDETHAKWLNTLSYLENCGARKIAACEHPTKVRREMLKHACEEFRHAFYLKQQMKKLKTEFLEDYSKDTIYGGLSSLRYLDKLEISICKALKKLGWTSAQIKEKAYICVTYAIEVRAAVLYPEYQTALKKQNSPISMRMLILEEDQHLAEMEKELLSLKDSSLVRILKEIEVKIYHKWFKTILY